MGQPSSYAQRSAHVRPQGPPCCEPCRAHPHPTSPPPTVTTIPHGALTADAPHAYQLGWAEPVWDLDARDFTPGTWTELALPRQASMTEQQSFPWVPGACPEPLAAHAPLTACSCASLLPNLAHLPTPVKRVLIHCRRTLTSFTSACQLTGTSLCK